MSTRRPSKTPQLIEALPRGRRGAGSARGRRSTARRVLGWLLALGTAGVVLAAAIVAALFLHYGSDPAMPRIDHVTDYHPRVTTHVTDKDGNLIGEIYDERRTVVPRDRIPAVMIHAIVDAEDAQFFEHKGLDYWGMVRAFVYNLRPGAHLQGASTITQQLVKTYLLKTSERTIKRKVQEAILARRLESKLTKDEILWLYLNQIYFGHRRHGVEEAARFFFGKGISDVDAGEAALLAALPKGPVDISPLRHPERAKDRQRYVLSQMLRYRHLGKEDAERFAAAPITLVRQEESIGLAPEFVDEVRRQLVARFGEARLPYLGLTVATTCEARVQKLAREALEKNLEALDERQGHRKPLAHVKEPAAARIKAVLEERSLRHLGSLLDDAPTRAQRTRWLADREKALAMGRVTEVVVVEVRGAPDDHGLVVDTGAERGFLRVPRPDAKGPARDRYNPKGLALEKRFAVGDVIAVRAEPSLGRHPGDARPQGTAGGATDARGPARNDVSDVHAADRDDGDADGDGGESGWPIVVPEFGPQGAVLVLDPQTRDVRAMVGGYGFHVGGFNRATQARRQPGSAFKPFLYAAAFASGQYTAATVLNDSPQIYEQPGLKAWKPKNAETHEFLGPVRLRVALARSLNTVASQLVYEVSPGALASTARTLGIESPLDETLALGLGASAVTLLEMTNAYATLAAQGRRAAARMVARVGEERLDPAPPVAVIKPELAYLVTSVMQSVIEEGTASSARGKVRRPAAGKTGTTSSQRDAWFVGFTPDVVVGVWVGFDDMRDLGRGEQGARSALPVWIETLNGALRNVPPSPFSQPPGLEVRRIDPVSGLLAAPGSPDGLDEVFLPGTAPTETAPQPGEENPESFITAPSQ